MYLKILKLFRGNSDKLKFISSLVHLGYVFIVASILYVGQIFKPDLSKYLSLYLLFLKPKSGTILNFVFIKYNNNGQFQIFFFIKLEKIIGFEQHQITYIMEL